MSYISGSETYELATIAGGCFWCLEAVYLELNGIIKVDSGYSGGHTTNPSYEDVCSGETGHAEAVQILFDSKVITYREILQIFFSIHDPTLLNRQGPDVGTQYRSMIFYHSDGQKRTAEEVIREINEGNIWGRPAVTELVPFRLFYKAEQYHQNYFKNNPQQGYCRVVIAPKVAKFRKEYFDRLRKKKD